MQDYQVAVVEFCFLCVRCLIPIVVIFIIGCIARRMCKK